MDDEITGKTVSEDYLPSDAASGYGAIASTIASDLAAHDEVALANFGGWAGSLVGGHMFEVTSVDTKADTITLQNPWNTANTDPYAAMSFTETIAQLAQSSTALFVASGASAYKTA